jgi:hypothetical protein
MDPNQLDPKDRADTVQDEAAAEFTEASTFYAISENVDTTAENLRSMGFGEAADVLHAEAMRESTAADIDLAQGMHLASAAGAWRTAADDLDQQAKAEGQAFVAGAAHRQADDLLHHSPTEAQKTQLEVTSAAAGATQAALEHRAGELEHAAESAAAAAIAHEAKARSLDK